MRIYGVLASLVVILTGCGAPQPGLTVTAQRPHDSAAFTQGLEFHGDRLYESRGLYGESAITEIDPTNGQVIKRVDLPPTAFGEGLTVAKDEIVQLTWQNGVAYRWTLDLEPKGEYTYSGEGWGLCWDGDRFVMSDGSSTLTLRNSAFEPIGTIAVTEGGAAVTQLNELECANGQIYANIWHANRIIRIDPASGAVTSSHDLTPHIPDGMGTEQVLNGIAHQPNGDWLITGKQWPVMLDTRIVEAD